MYRFYSEELPISERTHQLMKNMMVLEENGKYRISGKTGWSIRNGNNNGWFVGYLEKNGKVWFFATNVTPNEEFNMEMFPKIRKEITYTAFRRLGIL